MNVPVPNNMTREASEALAEEDVVVGNIGEDKHAENEEAEEGDEMRKKRKLRPKWDWQHLLKVWSCCQQRNFSPSVYESLKE